MVCSCGLENVVAHKIVFGSQHLWVFGLLGDLWNSLQYGINSCFAHCGLEKSVYRQLNLSVKPLTGFLVCKSCKDEPDSGVEQ